MVRAEGAEPPSPPYGQPDCKKKFFMTSLCRQKKDKISHAYKVKKTKWSSPRQAFEEKNKSWKYDPTIGPDKTADGASTNPDLIILTRRISIY